MTHPNRIRANNLEAARILADAGDHEGAQWLRRHSPPAPVRPAGAASALPLHLAARPKAVGRTWHDDPPRYTGKYQWRRDDSWEPIEREVTSTRVIFSERYCKEVPLSAIGGQWLY